MTSAESEEQVQGSRVMLALRYSLGIIAAFALGALYGHRGTLLGVPWPGERGHPAYLLAAWDVLQPDRLKPFGQAVIPLAQKAGFEMLAASSPEILEGEWPYKGTVYVEKYDSMEALLRFWRSPENQAAQQLRVGYVNSQFIVAVELP